MKHHVGDASRAHLALAAGLVAAFIVTRAALLVTSYDTNRNWEEPVFLFSATELARDGVAHVFDHQDDLNHGGSVVLLLIAVPWVSVFGTGLLGLKGIAVLWSALTLCAFMVVLWRYFSPCAALLFGLFCVALSPTAARLNVTLVGSHPEVVLPCAVAVGLYLEWIRRRGQESEHSVGLAAALGFASGVALWMAYMSAMIVGPVLVLRLVGTRRWRAFAGLGLGGIAGFSPWLYQDLWLRPHGATLWAQHILAPHESVEHWSTALSELVASFGYGGAGGWMLLGASTLAGLVLAWSASPLGSRLRRHSPFAVVPLVTTPILGLSLLAATSHPLRPVEGYYAYRFYIPLQISLLLILALAVDLLGERLARPFLVSIIAVAMVAGVWALAPLYGQGNHYRPDFEADRALGCHVFGVAEWDRSADPATAMARLGGLQGDLCRDRAFGGLGWALAADYLKRGDLDRTMGILADIGDERLRRSACAGVIFVLQRAPESLVVTTTARGAARQRVGDFCRPQKAA